MQESERIFIAENATLLRGSERELNRQLFTILNSIYDGLYITDGQANTILINRAYEEVSGLRREDVLGKSMQEIVATGMIDRSGSLGVLKTRKPVTLEQTFRTGKQALITSTPHFDSSGEITMIITVVRDMTEIYGLQRKYQESEERRRSEMEFLQRNQRFVSRMVAADPRTLEVLARAQKVAALDTTILLLGETGVGKEKIAKYIFKNSARREGRFLTVNCGAIAPNLIESELFGYVQGAFTGASRGGKPGLFEVADKGTLFLDEIGELPLEMQVKLLRVLQERTVTRVGGNEAVSVDVRVVAATNRDLGQMVRDKTFREDLFYRLNVVPITIPPLRERRDDIIPFAESFLEELNKKYNLRKRLTASACQAMLNYAWPGNVRELKNIIERMVIMSGSDQIRAEDLPFHSVWTPPLPGGEDGPTVDLKALTGQFELQFINRAYERFGNVRDAARSLGMDPATFVRKRKRYAQERLLQK